MNRAEARIKSFQNSKSQINARNDLTLGNSSILFSKHMKSMEDESNLARKLGRKKK